MIFWKTVIYGSGTHIVTSGQEEPWLYVYGPMCDSIEESDKIRHSMCEDLEKFLNKEIEYPLWLMDMERSTEVMLKGIDGSSIIAKGPMFDSNPPYLFWKECDDTISRDKRARLIDKIWSKNGCPKNCGTNS